MLKSKKKAFTLTELLVVVVIIGVLAAVILPKFNKVVETRKTTEAEELMASVRTEQEYRCAMDKPYIGDMAKLSDIIPNASTKNFNYSLETTGMLASSKGKYNYELKMPSYADGRVCCEGAGCTQLNKDYPTCAELQTKPDYKVSTECTATVGCGDRPLNQTRSCEEGNGTQTRTPICNAETKTWEWTDWEGECVSEEEPVCTPGEKEQVSCRCKVARGRVCRADGKGWENYEGTCEMTFNEKKSCECDTSDPEVISLPCEDFYPVYTGGEGVTGTVFLVAGCNRTTGEYYKNVGKVDWRDGAKLWEYFEEPDVSSCRGTGKMSCSGWHSTGLKSWEKCSEARQREKPVIYGQEQSADFQVTKEQYNSACCKQPVYHWVLKSRGSSAACVWHDRNGQWNLVLSSFATPCGCSPDLLLHEGDPGSGFSTRWWEDGWTDPTLDANYFGKKLACEGGSFKCIGIQYGKNMAVHQYACEVKEYK